jgi:hypothetical protein
MAPGQKACVSSEQKIAYHHEAAPAAKPGLRSVAVACQEGAAKRLKTISSGAKAL